MVAVKLVYKIITRTVLILTLIISIIGFMALRDASEFRERFPSEPNLFLLVEDSIVLAGAKDMMHQEAPRYITSDEIDFFQQAIDDKDKILGDNYKVFFMSMASFKDLPENIMDGSEFTKSEAEEALRHENIAEWYVEFIIERSGFPEELAGQAREQLMQDMPDEGEIRAMMFFLLLGGLSEKEGATFIITEYKSGNIEVYPETILFRFVRMAPKPLLKMMQGRMST